MYIIQTRAQILIPKFPLVTTVSWLPSRFKVRLATFCQASLVSVLCLYFHVHTGKEVPQKVGDWLKGTSSQKSYCPGESWQLSLAQR